MKALKKLFSSQPYTPAHEVAAEYLANVRLQSPAQLPSNYQIIMASSVAECQHPHQFLSQLLKSLLNLTDQNHIIKMLTLVHHFVVSRLYHREDIKELEEGDCELLSPKNNDAWFYEFYRSYITYLMKLPSLSDVYAHIQGSSYTVEPSLHLTHVFRIANTLRVLFPALLNAINVVGRYQAEKQAVMKDCFLVLSAELVKVYSYTRYLCEQIMRQYRVYNPKDLQCFLQYLPELELLCDKVEDLLVNKYVKGSRIAYKLEFREERVVELQYYLQYELCYRPPTPKSTRSMEIQ